MNTNIERKKQAILNYLSSIDRPVSGKMIAEHLEKKDLQISERTVRLYLKELENQGFLAPDSNRGRIITPKGRKELQADKLLARIGVLSSKINQLTYGMDFDLTQRRGNIIVNVTLIDPQDLKDHMDNVKQVFEKGYAMGTLVGLLSPGEGLGDFIVPPNRVGLCTVCSITLNGVLLKYGIPVDSLFGGLLELKKAKPTRFLELIYYNRTSIDPLVLFIQGGMTDYLGAIKDGNGIIGAGFREVPQDSFELVNQLAEKLSNAGLGALMTVGFPEQPVYNIPVHDGCCGMAVIGGLNPTAVFEESGIRLDSRALGGYLEYNQLFHYTELNEKLNKII